MKITKEHQEKLEELMQINAINRGAKGISDFICKAQAAMVAGQIPMFKKCEALSILSYLTNNGSALTFICDEIYEYANDSHLRTFYKALWKKHTS